MEDQERVLSAGAEDERAEVNGKRDEEERNYKTWARRMEKEVELCREGERKLCNSEGQRMAVKVAKQGADRRDKW